MQKICNWLKKKASEVNDLVTKASVDFDNSCEHLGVQGENTQ
jgi:hypothetical protein